MNDEQSLALSAILDTLIPPRPEGLPGAGALGLGDHVAASIAKMAGALEALAAGIRALDALAGERGEAGFAALTPEARADALRVHAQGDPGFLPGLVFHSYIGYYQDGRVMQALGLEARPPHPKGYEMAPTDLDTLTAAVRARPPLYRKP